MFEVFEWYSLYSIGGMKCTRCDRVTEKVSLANPCYGRNCRPLGQYCDNCIPTIDKDHEELHKSVELI